MHNENGPKCILTLPSCQTFNQLIKVDENDDDSSFFKMEVETTPEHAEKRDGQKQAAVVH